MAEGKDNVLTTMKLKHNLEGNQGFKKIMI